MTVEQKQVWLVSVTVDDAENDFPYDEVVSVFDGYPSEADLTSALSAYGFSADLVDKLLKATTHVVLGHKDCRYVHFNVERFALSGVTK